jgi:hypothetical protein
MNRLLIFSLSTYSKVYIQLFEHGPIGNAIQLMEGIQTHCIAILGHNDRSLCSLLHRGV